MDVIQQSLKTWFEAEGLRFLGVSSLDYPTDSKHYQEWIDDRMHAGMSYMEAHSHCRTEPKHLLDQAQSAISFALPYDQGDALARQWKDGLAVPRVAQYARFTDYHKLLKKRGERVAQNLNKEFGGTSRVAVDTAPVLERALAAQTRLGFIGKNTCYIHPEYGSFLLLGEIVSTIEVTKDEREESASCGECTRCQKYCPTNALDEAYRLDANRCLAYWTIENRGTIPEEYWPHLGTYVFGCDICQLVCPFNRGENTPEPVVLKTREVASLYEMATMNQKDYERLFGGTPMTRAKRNGLRRNALIAMAVVRDPRLEDAVSVARDDCESPIAETLEQMERFLGASEDASLKKSRSTVPNTETRAPLPRSF